ncbi:MAG: DUF4115 domain-containing protein [Gammaproteobacteria bacterium]|nr:DUF4115 domain-containing protein [Gammaproteobacteria bacterium]MDH5593831.1 DUF4115 domain-containing protein [Gammaproteobacteria bacterium]MDH5613685.1 DUF4115 domain-containing protein [Gammaproteobacteria bacterium]
MKEVREDVEQASLLGPGEKLRKTREEAGLSQQDVANKLNLHIKTINALENDNFDVLPEPIFVYGYLRAYARLLEISDTPLIEAYSQLGYSDPELSSVYKEKPAPTRADVMFHNTSISMVLVFAFLMVLWWYSFEPGMEQPIVVAESGTALAEIARSNNENDDIRVLREDVLENVSSSEAVATINEITKSNPPASSATKEAIMVLSFDGDSWVDISDAEGNRLVYDLIRAGRTKIVRGKAPFEIYLGNASVVRMEYNGEAFDLKPHVNGNLVRFKLGNDLEAQKIDG